jgi:hypothetical protein
MACYGALAVATLAVAATAAAAPPAPAPAEAFHFVVQKSTDTTLGNDLRHVKNTDALCRSQAKGHVCNVDALKMACLYDPKCAGFNTDGWLKTATGKVRTGAITDLYVKTVGKPDRIHYLKIEKWDADDEDLPGGRAHSRNVTGMMAECSANPACAGVNSNGILKASMATTGHSSCDLYVKLGGDPHPLPPGPPPGPPPRPPAPAQLPIPPAGPWAPSIWPHPVSFTNGSTTLVVAPPRGSGEFFTLAGGASSKTLFAAFERYQRLTLPHPTDTSATATLTDGASGIVTGVTVTVKDLGEAHPQLTTDESYSLTVSSSGAVAIDAPTIWGALHGLETFSQLVIFDFDTQQHTLPLAPWHIKDAPRFPHRGLMIDTSRHFETVPTIKKLISSLSYAKINVLHCEWRCSFDNIYRPFYQ